MPNRTEVNRGLRRIIHCVGFSCVGGAIFVEALIFAHIVTQGYFLAVERNLPILILEIILTSIGAVYFFYAYRRFLQKPE